MSKLKHWLQTMISLKIPAADKPEHCLFEHGLYPLHRQRPIQAQRDETAHIKTSKVSSIAMLDMYQKNQFYMIFNIFKCL